MELLLKNSPSSYETGDLVTTMPDGHQWGSGELDPVKFTVEKNVNLTDSQVGLLFVRNDAFKNVSAVSNIPAFRHSLFNAENLTHIGRRKYYYDNGVVKK
jgi:hypothetical protein